MRAIVLVGGEGTRLRPLTYDTPKQMLPIMGRPMLERVLANLARSGVTSAILSLGYLPDKFIAAYPDNTVAGVPVTYAVEEELLDTAGAIRYAATQGGVDETFVVVNGDVLTNLDLGALVAFHRERGAAATVALHEVEDPSRFGVVVTEPDGRVTAFIEKPPADEAPSREINAGTYVMEPAVLDLIASDRRVNVERETFPLLVARGSLYALADDGYWLDTGTPEAYLRAHEDVLGGAWPIEVPGAISGGNWVHPQATVDPSATLKGVAVHAGARVMAGATVTDSVLMADAEVHDHATVRGSVLGERCVIGRGADLGPTCVIGHDQHVAAGWVLHGHVRVGGPR